MKVMRCTALILGVSVVAGLACFGLLFTIVNAHAAMDANAALSASRTGAPCCTAQFLAHNVQRVAVLTGTAATAYALFSLALLALAAFRRADTQAAARLSSRTRTALPYFGCALSEALASGIVHPKIF